MTGKGRRPGRAKASGDDSRLESNSTLSGTYRKKDNLGAFKKIDKVGGWIAPPSGGYSANEQSTQANEPTTPPKGRAGASNPRKAG